MRDKALIVAKRTVHVIGLVFAAIGLFLILCLLSVIGVLWSLALTGIAVLASPIWVPYWLIKERRFHSRLRQAGRLLNWREADRRLRQGPCTLLIQVYQTRQRVWLTTEDVSEHCPLSLPDSVHHAIFGGDRHSAMMGPFDAWCAYRYCSADVGRADLIDKPRKLTGWFYLSYADRPQRWQARYPLTKLIWVNCRRESEEIVAAFNARLNDDPQESITQLLDAIRDDQPLELRWLAIEAIGMYGAQAAWVAPAFERRYAESPRERWNLAFALAHIGTDEAKSALAGAYYGVDTADHGPAWHALKAFDDIAREKRDKPKPSLDEIA